MPRILALLVAGALFVPAAATAQTVRGVVLDDGTRQPIPGALVEAWRSGTRLAAAVTDTAGAFTLRLPMAGQVVLGLLHIAFVADTIPITLDRGEVVIVELRMGRAAIPVDPIVVESRRDRRLAAFYERAEQASFGRYVTRAEIDRRPAARATDLIRELPRVDIVPTTMGNFITLAGNSGRCVPTIYMDGLVLAQHESMDRMLTADMIEGVEVHVGVAGRPLEFGHNPCGAVAFWTRLPAPVAPTRRGLVFAAMLAIMAGVAAMAGAF
jgi:hypothetical protein